METCDEKINTKFVMFSMTIFHSTVLPLPNKTKLKTAGKLRAFSSCHVEFALFSICMNLSPIRAVYTRQDPSRIDPKLERSTSQPKLAWIVDR